MKGNHIPYLVVCIGYSKSSTLALPVSNELWSERFTHKPFAQVPVPVKSLQFRTEYQSSLVHTYSNRFLGALHLLCI